jgi:hypothetical protein
VRRRPCRGCGFAVYNRSLIATWGVISASILKRADRADSSALQIFSQRFQLNGLVLVGDRGMTTAARRPTSGPPVWTGSPRCAHPTSGPSPRMTARCSPACFTPATAAIPLPRVGYTRDKVPRPRIEASAPPRVPNATFLVCRPLPNRYPRVELALPRIHRKAEIKCICVYRNQIFCLHVYL